MRCRCCDAQLDWVDLRITQDDGSQEDFCHICRGVVNRIDVPEDKEYLFEDATEGVKNPHNMENY